MNGFFLVALLAISPETACVGQYEQGFEVGHICTDSSSCKQTFSELLSDVPMAQKGFAPRFVCPIHDHIAQVMARDKKQLTFLLIQLQNANKERAGVAALALFYAEDWPKNTGAALQKSLIAGNHWALLALTRVDKQPTLAALARELDTDRGDFAAWALAKLKTDAFAVVLTALKHDSTQVAHNALTAISLMGPGGGALAPKLAAVAADPDSPKIVRSRAMRAIEAMAKNGRGAEKQLLPLLKEKDLEIRKMAQIALVATGSSKTERILAHAIASPSLDQRQWAYDELERIGSLGKLPAQALVSIALNGPPYGPQNALANGPQNGPQEERLIAARLLGYCQVNAISSTALQDALLQVLDQRDWRLSLIGLKSLSRFRLLRFSKKKVRYLARKHWSKAVRIAARAVLGRQRRCVGKSLGCYRAQWPQDPFVISSQVDHGYGRCAFHAQQSQDALLGLDARIDRRFPQTCGLGEQQKPAELSFLAGSGERISALFATTSGWLVGTDDAQWGGALWYVRSDGGKQRLLSETICTIVRRPNDILVLTSAENARIPRGAIYKLTRNVSGFAAEPLLELPGAPRSFQQHSNGTLLVEATQAAFTLDNSDTLQVFSCKQ